MLFRSPHAWTFLLCAVSLPLTRISWAQSAPQEPDAASPAQTSSDAGTAEEPAPKLVPFRPDTIGGHFQAGATGSIVFPFGSVSKDMAVAERSGAGGGGSIDLSYGLDRFVALGAYVSMSFFSQSDQCDGCSATALGSGAFVRYHVSQGLKLDPWVSYGMGFVTYGSESDNTVWHYSGLEWMRLQAGANWYATDNFILGPVLQLSATHLLERPSGEDLGGPLMRGTVGLRFAFDTPGR